MLFVKSYLRRIDSGDDGLVLRRIKLFAFCHRVLWSRSRDDKLYECRNNQSNFLVIEFDSFTAISIVHWHEHNGKLLPMTLIRKGRINRPDTAYTDSVTWLAYVTETKHPYLIVAILIRHHQKDLHIELNLSFSLYNPNTNAQTKPKKITAGISKISSSNVSSCKYPFKVCNSTCKP